MENTALRESGETGSAEFFVGPASRPKGRQNGARESANDGPLLELAVIAGEYGKTTLTDFCGGSIIFGGEAETEVELF